MKTIPRFSSLMVCFAGYLFTYILVTILFHLAPRQGGNILFLTLAGPACMILMFSLISVPMMDKRLKKHKPGYAEYARKTGALLPWTAKR